MSTLERTLVIEEQTPVRRLVSEAQAIAAAREIAVEIADIAADPRQNQQLPRRQAQLLSEGQPTLGVRLEVVAVGIELELGRQVGPQLARRLHADAQGAMVGPKLDAPSLADDRVDLAAARRG